MLELEQALEQILASNPEPEAEQVNLKDLAGRIALESVRARTDLPGFDNCSVDGCAVRAADVASARSDLPARLELAGRVAAGEVCPPLPGPGKCLRVFTGAPLPSGADAVVMQEDTRLDDTSPGHILVLDTVQPRENVRSRGEDVRERTQILESGAVLTPGRLALLAATGVGAVRVGRRPAVGLMVTGSELKLPGEPLAPNQIYECNRPLLSPLIERAGGIVQWFPLVQDTLDATRLKLAEAFQSCDVVVTSGGVSVGETDLVKAAFQALGGTLEFWRVAIKPGKPFVFGQLGRKHLFGLPGNPVSAFVTFLLLVWPALRWRQGAADVALPARPGALCEPLSNPGTRRHFMRVTLDANGMVRSAGKQGAHVLSSLASAQGLVDVPPQTTLAPQTVVQVLQWD